MNFAPACPPASGAVIRVAAPTAPRPARNSRLDAWLDAQIGQSLKFMVVLPDIFLWTECGRRPRPGSRHCVLPPARMGQSATSRLACADVRSQKASSSCPSGTRHTDDDV